MDILFNDLLQRSSIMNTYRLLHACIVLAAGVGLVSCTKEQKDPVRTQPTPFSQSLSPCQPAGVSSTGTPELCVNVTEVQLFSHELKADVGLSFVNRTGHRLFITLIGLTSLTDSSGKTWNTGDSKGLGSPNNPVPLEPAGETQGSISFYQNGQTSADLTFSLRGEIGIIKIDSHGQALPGQIVTKRGIQLSGIRIQQQPPHLTGTTDQHKNTKLAQLSPRRANSTTSNSSASSKSSHLGQSRGHQAAGSQIARRRHRLTQVVHPIKSRVPSILRPVMPRQTKVDRNPSSEAGWARMYSACASVWRPIRPVRCSSRMVSDHRPNPRIDPLTVMLRSRTR